MIYLVVAVIFLHLISAPIVVSVTAEIDSDAKIGVINVKLFFIPVFKKKIGSDIKSYLRGAADGVNTDRIAKTVKKPPEVLIEIAKKLLARVRVRELELNAHIGLGDAAASAVTSGFVRIMYGQLCKYLCCDEKGVITPDYDTEVLNGDFIGIISLCIADIIYAVLQALAVTAAKHRSERKRRNAKFIAE